MALAAPLSVNALLESDAKAVFAAPLDAAPAHRAFLPARAAAALRAAAIRRVRSGARDLSKMLLMESVHSFERASQSCSLCAFITAPNHMRSTAVSLP